MFYYIYLYQRLEAYCLFGTISGSSTFLPFLKKKKKNYSDSCSRKITVLARISM